MCYSEHAMKKKAITYYHILGVSPAASDTDIRQAYIALAQKFHPDRHSEDDKNKASRQFDLVHKAYMTLKTKPQRLAYNRYLNTVRQQRGEDMYISAFSGNDNRRPARKPLTENTLVRAAIIAREILWPFTPPVSGITATSQHSNAKAIG